MKEKELNPEEIQRLFDFVQSKYVRYKDVQYELVDHLASAIEVKQKADNNLDFESALREVYAGFPVTGFNHFLGDKAAALNKFFFRKLWEYMKDYLKLPKLIISGIIFTFFYQIFRNFGTYSLDAAYILYAIFTIVSMHKSVFYKLMKKDDRYLIINTYVQVFMTASFFYWYAPISGFMTRNITEFQTLNPMQASFFAIFLSIGILITHAFIYVFPEMLKNELRTKYAHLNIVLD